MQPAFSRPSPGEGAGPLPALRPRFVPVAPAAGQWLLERYELVAELGHGGMGQVWAVHDHALDLPFALKFLPPAVAREPGAARMLRREAQAALKLAHPNVVRLFHFHQGSGVSFLKMELIDGPSLGKLLNERGPLLEQDVRELLLQACNGLAEAHRHGIAHLDIKPDNLMLASDGVLKITDFGIARVVADTLARTTGEPTSGTLPYMSPEQVRGKPCDERSDLYSLGITAYELLSGHPPFHTGDIAHQHLYELPAPLATRAPHLWPIITRLLAKDPAKRIADVGALATALEGSVPRVSESLVVMYVELGPSAASRDTPNDVHTHRLVRRYADLVREQIAAFDGEEIKAARGEFVVAFSNPDRAVACAAAIQRDAAAVAPNAERPPALRIGMHYGRVVRDRGDLFGPTVNAASHIVARAQPGRILMGAALQQQLSADGDPALLDRGLFHLKGIREGLRLFELMWAPEATLRRARPDPLPAVGEQSPFVGRTVELRELERCLEVVEEGQGLIAALSGDPGVGKTRLAREFLQSVAPRSIAVAAGRCFENLTKPWQPVLECLTGLWQVHPEWTVPEALARDLEPLAELVPELSAHLPAREAPSAVADPQERRNRLLAGLASLYIHWSRQELLALFIDDVQWADRSTRDFLRHLARRLVPDLNGQSARILIVVSCRETELTPGHPLNELFAEIERDRLLNRIPVRGLAAGEVQTLLQHLHGTTPYEQLATFVFRRSQGNPYFVEEIYRDLAEQGLLDPEEAERQLEFHDEWLISRRVRDVLDQRLRRMDTNHRAVLRVAALIGLRFRFDVLRAAVERSEDVVVEALESALDVRVIREWAEEEGVYYAFEHGLAQEALADEGSIVRRQRIHLRIVSALESVYGEQVTDHAAEVLQHLLRAGAVAPAVAVVRHGAAAGDAALARFAFEDAAQCFEAVVAAYGRLDEVPHLDRAHAEFKLFTALGHKGEVERARELANDVIRTFDTAGDGEEADRARLVIGMILRRHTRQQGALPYLESVAKKAGDNPSYVYAMALGQYAVTAEFAGNGDETLRCAQELHAIARTLGDPHWAMEALGLEGLWHLNHTRAFERAIAISKRRAAYHARQQDRWSLCRELGDFAFCNFLTGRITKALETCEEAIALAEEIGTHYEILDNRAVRAICHCFRGDWDSVDREWELSAPHLRRVPGTKRLGLLIRARVRTDLWRGHESLRVPSARKNYEDMPLTEIPVAAATALGMSEREEPGRAADLMAQVTGRVPATGDGLMWLVAAQALSAGWVNLGDAGRAATWYESLAPYAHTLYLSSTGLERARVASANSWWPQALADFTRCTRACRREGLRPVLAIALFEKARMYTSRGRPGDEGKCKAALMEARQLFDELRMPHYLDRIQELRRA